jgi:hypothetical protein
MGLNRIGMVKKNYYKSKEENLEPADNLVLTLDWFTDKHFRFRSKDVKEELVKARLQNIDKSSLKFDRTKIGKKERLVVHRKPDYGMEDAVFDKEISMPRNLVDRKKQVKYRG